MKQSRPFLLLIGILLFTASFGQQQKKIYYNDEWKGCSENEASYFRIAIIDNKGKAIGKVRDFFITGEKQSEIDGALYIDNEDDSRSVFVGKSIGYYKSGKKAFENIQDNKGKLVKNVHWHENGKLKYIGTYKNGVIDLAKYYDENGKIMAEVPSINGEPDTLNQKVYYYYDDSTYYSVLVGYADEEENMTGKLITCYPQKDSLIMFMNSSNFYKPKTDWKVYIYNSYKIKPYAILEDNFSNTENENPVWQLSDDENASVKIRNNSLVFDFKGTRFIRKAPLYSSALSTRNNDFEVKTVIAKESNTFFEGIIFGYRGSKNYSALTFSKIAKMLVYEKYENGITTVSDEASKIYLVDYADNEVRLIKKNGRIKIFFNGVEAYEVPDSKLSGDIVGLCAAAGNTGEKAIFKSFKVVIGEQPSAGFENITSTNTINVKRTGGVYSVPVELNGVLKIDFIFDSGASDVSISPDVALILLKTGTIKNEDWLPGAYYSFADGSTAKSARFKLKSVKIGNKTITNVVCSISNSIHAPMLLGQSVLGKFGKYTFDNNKLTLTLD